MKTTDYSTTILVDKTAAEVFQAINNVSAWWHGSIEGSTDKLHDEFTYRMKEFHFSKQKIVALVPNKKVVWQVTESKLSFTENPSEWTGTEIAFDLSEVDNRTQVQFTHIGLVPQIECYGDCSNGWEKLIQESLLSLITTGKGTAVFG